jgi:hypothetical protein
VVFSGSSAPPVTMSSASCGEKKALETAQPLELGDLLGDTALERLVPLGQLLPVARFLIVQPLLLDTRRSGPCKSTGSNGLPQ